jgi:PEP-CTERM motif
MKHCRQAMKFSLLSGAALLSAVSSAHAFMMIPGDIIVSESTFVPNTGEAAALTPGSPIIVAGAPAAGATGNAVAGAGNLTVFQNSGPDANFGIGAPLSLVQFNPATMAQDGTLALPTSQIVTSFPSKSEGSLYLTQNGAGITIAGYAVQDGRNPVGALDISNASTSATSGASSSNANGIVNRTAAVVNFNGAVSTTNFNAYSGNNPRGAILYNNTFYMVGNGNAGNTGVEALTAGNSASLSTTANNTTQIGTYNITQNGYTADKAIKDNNFRGETIYNNTLYVTKGSGSNGIDTVYQVGATGALANGANLPANAPITILPGFPTSLAKGTGAPTNTPFGLWFANSTTLYVSDEGTGGVSDVGPGSNAGLEKWSLVNGTWQLDYTLQNGLVGQTQTYTGLNGNGLVGTVTEQGLRDISGVVNSDGTVTIYGVTSTTDNITGNDNGDDPNQLVSITDMLSATTRPANESFSTLIQAPAGTVIRGVTEAAVPEPGTLALIGSALLGLGFARRRRAA